MWAGYLLALMGMDLLMYARAPWVALNAYYLANWAAALVFLGLAYWPGIERALGRCYVPLMLVLITALPVLAGRLSIPRLPPGPMANIEGMALRTLPVLFIALVITAWRYSFRAVVVFALGTALLEIGLALAAMPPVPGSATHATLYIAIVRSISFLVVGYFISRLMHQLGAQQAALAQANTQLTAANARLTHYASTLETLTISRERNRMARELHDTLAHTLSGLAVQLETARAYQEVDPQAAGRLVDQALQATRSGLQETRRALKALRASPLDDLGLRLALQQLAEEAAQRGSLQLMLELPAELRGLAPDVEQCLYRVAQEAVENVVQHAAAHRLALRLECGAERLALVVSDDGIGFRPGAGVPEHYGLPGMRERAQLAGGQLAIESAPGQGTRVRLEIEPGSSR